ncbi:MAG TPA: hypothetical protein VH482_19510 [Thermomicrobiales bacterium]|jgi:hypothetical protein
MAIALKTAMVEPDGEVARVLTYALDEPILIDTRRARFRVVREDDDPFANYDPEQVRAALEGLAGSLRGVDVDVLLAEPREQRSQDSQGRPA